MTQYRFFDGKSYSVLDDTPGLWTYFSASRQSDADVLYARVAAAFRAFNIKADAVGGMPFSLTNLKTGDEYDNSATWENKVKFLPNPFETFRLDTLSYMASNTVYNLLTKDVLGRKDKMLRNAVPSAFVPNTDPITGNVAWIERRTGMEAEKYEPATGKLLGGSATSPRLIYMWRMDHTTEVLPSANTEAQAITNAAGIIYHADVWIRHFFERGGVVPMIIATKGMTPGETNKDREEAWTKWYLGLRNAFSRIFRVVNAETMDVKQVGSGIEQLKDNVTYTQAISNIAMATGMPLSLLLANSANRATAISEKASWYDGTVTPFCNWLAYGYNEQVFHPMGLHLKFHPETLDPQQEDETQRAQAFITYGSSFTSFPTYGLWRGMADTLGLELSDSLDKAAQEYYAEKKKNAEKVEEQTQQKPGPEQPEAETDTDEVEMEAEDDNETVEKKSFEYSSMIALRIPDVIRKEIATRYSFVDSETLDNLHITLVYLGDNRTLDKLDIVRAVSDFGMYQSPIKGTLQGLARFVNGSDRDPLVCTFDSPQMPGAYNILTGALDNYNVPYHKEHGFIPHMTLAYIPSDADMPIETIEPIEINFSEVFYVDGNVWYPVDLVGYENKTATGWLPSLNELEELRVWREVATRRFKKGESLVFDYEPHHGGVPAEVVDSVKAKLATAATAEDVKAAFDISGLIVKAEQESKGAGNDNTAIQELAAAINKLAEAK